MKIDAVGMRDRGVMVTKEYYLRHSAEHLILRTTMVDKLAGNHKCESRTILL